MLPLLVANKSIDLDPAIVFDASTHNHSCKLTLLLSIKKRDVHTACEMLDAYGIFIHQLMSSHWDTLAKLESTSCTAYIHSVYSM